MTEEQSVAFQKKARKSKSDLRSAIHYLEAAIAQPGGSIGRRLRIKDALDCIADAEKIEKARAALGI